MGGSSFSKHGVSHSAVVRVPQCRPSLHQPVISALVEILSVSQAVIFGCQGCARYRYLIAVRKRSVITK